MTLVTRGRLSLVLEPRDVWVGPFLDTAKRRAYVCLLPCLPIVYRWGAT